MPTAEMNNDEKHDEASGATDGMTSVPIGTPETLPCTSCVLPAMGPTQRLAFHAAFTRKCPEIPTDRYLESVPLCLVVAASLTQGPNLRARSVFPATFCYDH